jgi:hypothetical protein
VSTDQLNFEDAQSNLKVAKLLEQAQADVVVNSAGVFINGYEDTHHSTMDINFGSNWSIVRYYTKIKETKRVGPNFSS